MNDILPPVDTDDSSSGGSAQPPAPAPRQNPSSAPAPRQGRSGSNGPTAPVGDIQVKKKAKTYNTYTLSLSMGQIEAIHSALEKDHANPIADELLALFSYYLKTVPGPGEEEEDVQAQDEQNDIEGGGGEGEGEDDGLPLPMPPGYKGDGRTTVAGQGEDDGGSPDHGVDFGGGADEGAPTSLPGGDDEMPEEDRRLPAPPRE